MVCQDDVHNGYYIPKNSTIITNNKYVHISDSKCNRKSRSLIGCFSMIQRRTQNQRSFPQTGFWSSKIIQRKWILEITFLDLDVGMSLSICGICSAVWKIALDNLQNLPRYVLLPLPYTVTRDNDIGIHLADASMWLACVTILAAFNISPKSKDGDMILPTLPTGEYMDGSIRCEWWMMVHEMLKEHLLSTVTQNLSKSI